MKKIFLVGIISLFCSNFVNAQVPIERDSVFQTPGLSISQIYDGVKKWFVVSCSDSRDVIQIDDPANGSIVGKLFFPYDAKSLSNSASYGFVSVVVDIKIREGRFKIKFSDFNHTSTHPKYSEWWSMGLVKKEIPDEWKSGLKWKQKRDVYNRLLPFIDNYINQKLTSLSGYMKAYIPTEEEDW